MFLHRGDLPLFLISYKSWFMHQSSISTPSRWSGLVPPGSGSQIQNFFGLKPARDQDGANKKKFSQIGPAVPEEIGRKQTSCCYIIEIEQICCRKSILKGTVRQFSWLTTHDATIMKIWLITSFQRYQRSKINGYYLWNEKINRTFIFSPNDVLYGH